MHYLISGLWVESSIPLDGVASATPTHGEPDVQVRRGNVPDELSDSTQFGPNWMLAGESFLLRIPCVARMLVRAGCEIIVDVEGSCGEADAVPFILGSGFGVLLHQRGTLTLHASAVAHAGRAIALCGPSGVGKSTLSAALCQAGCSFISDDISAIRFDTGYPQVLPDSREHRLWADAIGYLDMSERQGEAVRETIEKYHVTPISAGAAMPLSMLVVLREADFLDQQPVIEPLDMADAAALLRSDVYRSSLATRMGRDAELFGQIGKLLGHVRIYRMTRPREHHKLDNVVALLRSHVLTEG